jgi:LSM domain
LLLPSRGSILKNHAKPVAFFEPHDNHLETLVLSYRENTMAPAQPELKKYLDKRLFVQLNGSRKVIGVLRGYDVSTTILEM